MRRLCTLVSLQLLACAPPASEDTGAVDSTSGFEEVPFRLLQTGEANGATFLTEDHTEYRENSNCEDRMEFNAFTDFPAYEDWVVGSLAGAALLAAPDWGSEIVMTGTLDCASALRDFDVEYVRLHEDGALQVGFLLHNVDCLSGGLVTRYFIIVGVEPVAYSSASAEWRKEMETGCYE